MFENNNKRLKMKTVNKRDEAETFFFYILVILSARRDR